MSGRRGNDRAIPSRFRRPDDEIWTESAPGWRRGVRGLLPAALLAYHHVGYPLLLLVWDRAAAGARAAARAHDGPDRHSGPGVGPDPDLLPSHGSDAKTNGASPPLPRVALIIPAHNEAAVIKEKVAGALALDYPSDLLRVVVAADGCTDDTVEAAELAGADVVLDLPRGGKMAAQHRAIAEVDEPIVAFSDANSVWEPGALKALVRALTPARTGYACGHVRFVRGDAADGDAAGAAGVDGGGNQEGLYWRYEMAIRERESRLASVTAGNGAIYAIKRAAYDAYRFDPVMGHDLAMPFQLVRAGWRAVDVPEARATEKMVPTIDGEFRRKRRMMSHAWPIVLRAGLLDLRGQTPSYALMLVSHRWLRYFGPGLHLWLAAESLLGARRSWISRVLVAGQVALLAAAARPEALPKGPLRKFGLVARYYVATNASIALGLRDHLVDGTEASWTPPEGTR